MADPIAAWHAEHVYFKQLLALLHKQVDAFHTGERPNYELMFDIISYLKDYSDQFHHPREDVAFARAVRKAVPAANDPLFGERVEARYQELRRQIAREAHPGN